MRKILINARFLSQSVTGVQRYAREIIEALIGIKQNQYSFLLCTRRGGMVNAPHGIDVLQDDSMLAGHLWEQVRLPYLSWKWRSDLLWSPCNVGPICSAKQVITIHDASVFAGPGWFSREFRFYYQFLLPTLGKKAILVVTDSEFSKEQLVRYRVVPEEKIRIVKGGVSERFFLDGSLPRKKLFPFPYVLSMGLGDPRKNVALLIKCWDGLPKDVKGGRKLVIYGTQGKAFPKMKVESFPSDVYRVGYACDTDLPELYGGADAFFYPSLYEGFGLPPLEAMAAGTPVLASGIGALTEMCGDAALYCDPRSEGDLSEKMLHLLQDEKSRKKMAERGRAQAGLFRWESAASRLLEVFEEAA